jgi:hypothetical protein
MPKVNPHITAQQKRALLDALRASLGIVETACKRAGVGRRTHYDWLKKDQKYAAEVAEIEDVALDFGETQLHKLMHGYSVPDSKVFLDRDTKEPIVVPITKHYGPDASSVIFFLKTKGKRRGYIEKTQVEHSGSIGGISVEIIEGKERRRG